MKAIVWVSGFILGLLAIYYGVHKQYTTNSLSEFLIEQGDVSESSGMNVGSDSYTLSNVEALICPDEESSLVLARTFARVGSDPLRHSVAYEALLRASSCEFINELAVDVRPIFRAEVPGGGRVAVHKVVPCPTCRYLRSAFEVKGYFLIAISPIIMNNIMRCEVLYYTISWYQFILSDTPYYCWRDT